MNVTTSEGARAREADSATHGPRDTDQHTAFNSPRNEGRTRYAPRCRGRMLGLHALTVVGLMLTAGGAISTAHAIDEHESITEYTGPEVCIDCHETAAQAAHGGVHYQQGGAFPDVLNIPEDFYAAGERPAHPEGETVATGLNTYCGTHEGSPRFTCAGCHVGNGRFPKTPDEMDFPPFPFQFEDLTVAQQNELANVDCLMCHQELYKRFPDWTEDGYGFSTLTLVNLAEVTDPETGETELVPSPGDVVLREGYAGIPNVDSDTLDFQFLPAGEDTLPAEVPIAPMTLTTLEAAQKVHATTRASCLNCHAGAAGSDGAKRGDLFRALANDAPPELDYHMSPQGANQTCSDCHNAGGHRLRGRGLDLRPSDVPERFTCAHCHTDQPHKDYSAADGSKRDTHATKVACQTCHIPRYGKAAVGTEVARDWQDPHPSAKACAGRGGWLPREDKDHDLIPSYVWFDGQSAVYYLGAALSELPTIPLAPKIAASFVGDFKTGQKAYVMAAPTAIIGEDGQLNRHRGAQSPEAKIYPMKEHWGKLATDGEVLIGHSTFEFFRTGSFCRAVAVGLGLDEVNEDPSNVCKGLPGDPEMPPGTEVVAVHTFQTINHGVEPKGRALGCGACHASEGTGPTRMQLKGELGYGPRQGESLVPGSQQRGRLGGNLRRICAQCHADTPQPQDFAAVHRVHVAEQGTDCAACHDFSRPARGLSLKASSPKKKGA